MHDPAVGAGANTDAVTSNHKLAKKRVAVLSDEKVLGGATGWAAWLSFVVDVAGERPRLVAGQLDRGRCVQ